MSEKIRVLNTRDRYYNGAYKGNILEIEKKSLQEYLNAGFVLVSDTLENKKVEIKNNIEDQRTIEDLKAILDHYGINYSKKAKKTELLALVRDFENQAETEKKEEKTDLAKIKKQILAENIETKTNLSKMSDSEIMELAKNNGLI